MRPHVTSFTHRDKRPAQGILSARLLNKGIGPAFIKSFRILLDGEPVRDPHEALRIVLAGRKYDHKITILGTDYAMSVGEEKDILVVAVPLNEGETLAEIEEQLNRFDLIVDYESAYEERWTFDTRKDTEAPLRAEVRVT